MSLKLSSYEDGFIIYTFLKGAEFKQVHFRFGLEGVWQYLGDIRAVGCPKCIW